jgi:O-antigen/teichoic acid export membrane protein
MASSDEPRDYGETSGIEREQHILAPILEKKNHVLDAAVKNGRKRDGAESYLPTMRGLIKSSGIYALSSLASPLVALVLAPFLTRHLSRADYGALAVLNVFIILASVITQLGIGPAFFRAYNWDFESQRDRFAVLSTSVILLSLVSISVAIAMMITAPWLAELLLNSASFSSSVRIAALVVPLQNLTLPGLLWLRAEKRATFFSILSIGNLLVTLSANILLVGVLHLGINGSLIATGGGYATVVICTLPVILLRVGLRRSLHLRFDVAWNLVFFGMPIVFSAIASWFLNLSDRYLLSHLGSLAQAAGYTVAYTLGGVLTTVILSPFNLAWPPMMYEIAKREEAAHIFQLVFRWFGIVLLFATFALSLLSKGVLDILFPPEYHAVAPIIPIIALSYMFYGVYLVFTVGVYIRRRTWLIVIFTTFAALVNLGLNIVLIPRHGPIGAAVSTLLAFILLALVAYIANQRIYPLPFEIGIFSLGLFAGVALFVGSSFIARTQETYVGWGISIGALALYGGCLMLLGKLPVKSNKHKNIQKHGVSTS